MKNLSKHSYSNLNLSEREIPGLKDMPVGSKHRFVIEAEHQSTSNNEHMFEGEVPMVLGKGGKLVKGEAMPKLSARFKVTAVEHSPAMKKGTMGPKDKTMMPKGKKPAKLVKSVAEVKTEKTPKKRQPRY